MYAQKNIIPDTLSATAVVISRHRILDMCENYGEKHPELQLVKKCMSHPDKQNTAVCEWIVMCNELQECLQKEGFHKDAYALEVFAGGFKAFEKKGYSTEQRTAMIKKRTEYVDSLLGNRVYDPMLANQSHVAGMSSLLLQALRYNGDGRIAILEEFPDLIHTLCEQALGSNGVELQFSSLREHSGYEPDPQTAVRHLTTMVRMAALRTDPDSSISLYQSRSRNYPIQKLMKEESKWRDPSQQDNEYKFAQAEASRITRGRGDIARATNKAAVLAGTTNALDVARIGR